MNDEAIQWIPPGKVERLPPAPLLLFPMGTLSDEDKAELKSAGYIAIQHPNPESVLQLTAASNVLALDDFMMAALSGLRTDRTAMCTFVAELHNRAKKNEASRA